MCFQKKMKLNFFSNKEETGGNVNLGLPLFFPFSDTQSLKEKKLI